MPLVTRRITTKGHPFRDAAGNALCGVRVDIQLVSCTRPPVPISVWDAAAKELVLPEAIVATTKSVAVDDLQPGELDTRLWPNSRGAVPSQYRLSIRSAGQQPIYITVTEGDTDADLADLVLGTQSVDPVGMSVVQDLLARVAELEAARIQSRVVSDAANGKRYDIVSRDGVLESVEVAGNSRATTIIIRAIDTGLYYRLYTINGGIVTEELSSGPAQNNTLTDVVSGAQYRLIVSAGELGTEEL